MCVGTHTRAPLTYTSVSKCARTHTHTCTNKHARIYAHEKQLMPRKWSVQLMDGSYTAIMTYFDVGRQSRPILDSEQRALANIL